MNLHALSLFNWLNFHGEFGIWESLTSREFTILKPCVADHSLSFAVEMDLASLVGYWHLFSSFSYLAQTAQAVSNPEASDTLVCHHPFVVSVSVVVEGSKKRQTAAQSSRTDGENLVFHAFPAWCTSAFAASARCGVEATISTASLFDNTSHTCMEDLSFEI